MPKGIVIIDWDKMEGPVTKLIYPKTLQEELNPSLPMQVFMMHTSKEPPQIEVSILVETSNISSYYFQFKQKGALRRIILMLLLHLEEPASDFFYILRNMEERIRDNIDNPKLLELIREIYETEIIADKDLPYSAATIRDKLSERVKVLLDNKKMKEAQALLAKSEEIPFKLAEVIKPASKTEKGKEHVKAAEIFDSAAELALAMKESDIHASCKNKAMELRKIPVLQNEMMEVEEKEVRALKKLLFNEAATHFEKGVQLAEQLTKFETTKPFYQVKKDEFEGKVKAIMQFLKAESKKNEGLKKLGKKDRFEKYK